MQPNSSLPAAMYRQIELGCCVEQNLLSKYCSPGELLRGVGHLKPGFRIHGTSAFNLAHFAEAALDLGVIDRSSARAVYQR